MPLFGEIVVIKRNGSDGTHFPLTATTCLFGRKAECDIRIQLTHVSKEHCKVEVKNKEVFATNLSSVNPTQLNGRAIQEPVRLKHGDVLTIIDRSFRFEEVGSKPVRRRSTGLGSQNYQVLQIENSTSTDETVSSRIIKGSRKSEGVISKTTHTRRSLQISSNDKALSPFSELYEMLKSKVDSKKSPVKAAAGSPKNVRNEKAENSTQSPVSPRRASRGGKANASIAEEANLHAASQGASGSLKSPSRGRRSSLGKHNKDTDAINALQTNAHLNQEMTNILKGDGEKNRTPRKSGKSSLTESPGFPFLGNDPVIQHGEKESQKKQSPRRSLSAEQTPSTPPANSKSTPGSGSSYKKKDTNAKLPDQIIAGGDLAASPLSRRLSRRSIEASPKVPDPKVESTAAGTKKSPRKRKSSELAFPEPPMKRKRVSFGGHLSPELFDKRLPPNSPLKRGATPARRSLSTILPQAVIRKSFGLKQAAIKELRDQYFVKSGRSAFIGSPTSSKISGDSATQANISPSVTRSTTSAHGSPKSLSRTPAVNKSSKRFSLTTPVKTPPGLRVARGTPDTSSIASSALASFYSSSSKIKVNRSQIMIPAALPGKKLLTQLSPPKTPAKRSPAQASPAKRSPAQASPAKRSPAQASPAKRSPAQASPAKRSPAKASPAKTPAKRSPAKASPAKTPAKRSPAKASPAKTPAKRSPAKASPAKTPAKRSPAKASPAKTPAKRSPAKASPAKTPAKRSPAKASPAKTPAKASPAKTPAKRSPAKASPAKTPAKRSPAKASPAKTPAKRSPAKASPAKTPAKRSPAKRSPAKTPAKRSPAKTPAKRSPAKTPAQATPAKTPAQATPAKTPAQATPAKTPAQATPAKTPAQATPAKTPAKRSPAQATPAKTPAQATPAKTPARRSPAQATPAKTPARRSPAQATPAKTPARRSPAQATPAKTPSRRSPAQATPAKTPSRRSPAQATPAKTPARRSPAQATPAKTPARRSPAQATPAKTPARRSPAQATPAKTPAQATPSKTPAQATPAKTPAQATPAKTPAKRSPAQATPAKTPAKRSPAQATPAKTPAKRSPAQATPAKTPAKRSPAQATPAKTPAKRSPAKGNPYRASPIERTLFPKSPATASPIVPYTKGRFSISRVKTPPQTDPVSSYNAHEMHSSQTPKTSRKSFTLRKTPGRRSRKLDALEVTRARRRTGASAANLLLARSWADVVKIGVAKPQKKNNKPASKVKILKKAKVIKTPLKNAKHQTSTGHVDSPATILIGKAHSRSVNLSGHAPKVVRNTAAKINIDLNESFTGVAELFSTPVNTKQRRSIRKTDDTSTPKSVGSEISVIKTPEESGEMVVSPMNSPLTAQRTYRKEAVSRLLQSPVSPELPKGNSQEMETIEASTVIQSETEGHKPQEAKSNSNKGKALKMRNEKRKTIDLTGIKRMYKTPRQKGKPITDPVALKKMLRTPKYVESLPVVYSRKSSRLDDLVGIKNLMKGEPVQDLTGIKRIMKTPRQKGEPVEDLIGIKRMMRTPKQKVERVEDLTGVKRIMRTPKQRGEPVEDMIGIKRIMATPKEKGQPLEDMEGISRIMSTPTENTHPIEEIFGIKQLIKTPPKKTAVVKEVLGVANHAQTGSSESTESVHTKSTNISLGSEKRRSAKNLYENVEIRKSHEHVAPTDGETETTQPRKRGRPSKSNGLSAKYNTPTALSNSQHVQQLVQASNAGKLEIPKRRSRSLTNITQVSPAFATVKEFRVTTLAQQVETDNSNTQPSPKTRRTSSNTLQTVVQTCIETSPLHRSTADELTSRSSQSPKKHLSLSESKEVNQSVQGIKLFRESTELSTKPRSTRGKLPGTAQESIEQRDVPVKSPPKRRGRPAKDSLVELVGQESIVQSGSLLPKSRGARAKSPKKTLSQSKREVQVETKESNLMANSEPEISILTKRGRFTKSRVKENLLSEHTTQDSATITISSRSSNRKTAKSYNMKESLEENVELQTVEQTEIGKRTTSKTRLTRNVKTVGPAEVNTLTEAQSEQSTGEPAVGKRTVRNKKNVQGANNQSSEVNLTPLTETQPEESIEKQSPVGKAVVRRAGRPKKNVEKAVEQFSGLEDGKLKPAQEVSKSPTVSKSAEEVRPALTRSSRQKGVLEVNTQTKRSRGKTPENIGKGDSGQQVASGSAANEIPEREAEVTQPAKRGRSAKVNVIVPSELKDIESKLLPDSSSKNVVVDGQTSNSNVTSKPLKGKRKNQSLQQTSSENENTVVESKQTVNKRATRATKALHSADILHTDIIPLRESSRAKPLLQPLNVDKSSNPVSSKTKSVQRHSLVVAQGTSTGSEESGQIESETVSKERTRGKTKPRVEKLIVPSKKSHRNARVEVDGTVQTTDISSVETRVSPVKEEKLKVQKQTMLNAVSPLVVVDDVLSQKRGRRGAISKALDQENNEVAKSTVSNKRGRRAAVQASSKVDVIISHSKTMSKESLVSENADTEDIVPKSRQSVKRKMTSAEPANESPTVSIKMSKTLLSEESPAKKKKTEKNTGATTKTRKAKSVSKAENKKAAIETTARTTRASARTRK